MDSVDGGDFFGPFAVLARDARGAVSIVDIYDDELAAIYEEEVVDMTYGVPFFVSAAVRFGDPVLELGCGGGRLALKLAGAQCSVHAVDRSEAMLEIFRGRLNSTRLQSLVKLERADLYARRPSCTYRTIIVGACMFPSFLAVGGAPWLEGLHSALQPGGALCFDVGAPPRSSDEPQISCRTTTILGRKATVVTGSSPSGRDARVTNRFVELEAQDGPRRLLASETVRSPSPATLVSSLLAAGFADISRTPLDNDGSDPLSTVGWIARRC